MKWLLLILLPVIILSSCSTPQPLDVGVIPMPNSIVEKKGAFVIDSKTTVYATNLPATQKVANEFVRFVKDNYGIELKTSEEKSNNSIAFELAKKEGGRRGEYFLDVSKHKIRVKSASDEGIYYAMQTLKQLLTPVKYFDSPAISCMEVKDYPQFEWRGLMLDVSRHFFTKDSVKKILDIMAMHKMNKFHWHLTDGIGWRIQIDKYPMLTEKGAWRVVQPGVADWNQYETCIRSSDGSKYYGGFYTKDDIREIIRYAAERYIEVIPEIEMPGHSQAALQCYPELQCTGAHNSGVYCAGNEKTFEFLQNVLYEVMDLFPSKYIHIGGDEVGKTSWLNCALCQKRMKSLKITTGEELQSYFITRIEKFVNLHGKKLIGWDEILEGGLPARATVMSWRGTKGGIEAANTGHDVIMTPGSPCYFDHSQGLNLNEPDSWGGYNPLMKVYDFFPVPPDIDMERKHHILGAQANLWTEKVATLKHAEYMILPRLAALAEVNWTLPQNKNSDGFIRRIDVMFDRYKELGYNYAGSSFSPVDKVVYNKDEKSFVLSLSNELGLYDIYYTLDGTKPTVESSLYAEPIVFTEPVDLYAICFRKGVQAGYPLVRQYSTGLSDKCSVTYKYPYNSSYSGGGDKALCDNRFALNRGDDKHWQGFKKNNFDVTIDLGEPITVSTVAVDFFQHLAATSVMLPLQVEIMISEDGENFTTVLDEKYETIDDDYKPIIDKVEAKFPKQKVKNIHIIAKNRGVLPGWHIRKGGDAWIFVDEVMVR